MKTVNLKSSFVVILFAALCTLASCSKKKDDVAPPASPLAGKWVGKWGAGNSTPDVYFSFTISSNGTLTVLEGNNTDPGAGTWTVNGETFKAVYHYGNDQNSKLNVAAKLNDAKTEMVGDWGYGEVNQGEGTFYMVKQ
jgi:hypothetical protein